MSPSGLLRAWQRSACSLQHAPMAYAAGEVTRYEYDPAGNLTRTVSPSGRVIRMTYDTAGRLLSTTDAASNTTHYTHDSFGNVRTVTDPEGHTTGFGYDAAGRDRVVVTNARGHVTRYEYDANRRLTRVTEPGRRGSTWSAAAISYPRPTSGRSSTPTNLIPRRPTVSTTARSLVLRVSTESRRSGSEPVRVVEGVQTRRTTNRCNCGTACGRQAAVRQHRG